MSLKTIIQGDALNILRNYPKLLLKLNSEFKKMKLTKVNYGKKFDDYSYEKDLTLYICPECSEDRKSYFLNIDFKKVYEVLRDMDGWDGGNEYYMNTNKDRKPIKAKINGQEIEIGCYFPKRNIVIIYFKMFSTRLSLIDKNELLFMFVKILKDWIKKYKIKKVDINDKIDKIIISKFCEVAKEGIRTKERHIEEKRRQIKQKSEDCIRHFREINCNYVEIKALESMLKNTKTMISKQIKEIESLSFVKKVTLQITGIKVEVENIVIKHEGEDIKMGNYFITLFPNKITIKAKNPVKKNGYYIHHPHINGSNGEDICYGDRKDKVRELLGNYDFKKLIYFLYLYLKGYNEDDCYNKIKYWTEEDYDEDNDEEGDENGSYY